MDSDEFRRVGHQLVDWMADYLDHVEDLPVRARVRPGEVAAALPPSPPAAGEPIGRIIADFKSLILPGVTHWQHPRFFGFFPANSSRPSVLAEMLTATLGAQCMSWETSPAATELETRVLEWLRQMIGLPDGFVGCIQDTASTATLCALITARERVSGYAISDVGMSGAGQLTAYYSTEAHSSIVKDVRIAGLGRENLRLIPVDDSGAMRPDALNRAITADLTAGKKPTFVAACVGTSGTGGIDSLADVGKICSQHGVWLHVDAAWAGSALVIPEFRWLINGIEHADSLVFNPHKWLFTNFDCSAYYVRDSDALIRTFEVLPEYLRTTHDVTVTNYRDWGIQLGRRFRALKLWFVIRSYGVDGLREKIAAHIAMAQELASRITSEPDFEIVIPPVLSMVCFRFKPPAIGDRDAVDAVNEELRQRLNDSGKLYLTHTRWRGAYVLRFVVGQTETEPRHVAEAWECITETARSLAPIAAAPDRGPGR